MAKKAKKKGDAIRPKMDGDTILKIGFIAHMIHGLVVYKQIYGTLMSRVGRYL